MQIRPSRNALLTFILSIVIILSTGAHSLANSEMREWSFVNGENLRAEIVSVDEATHTVRLRSEKGQEMVVSTDQLSTIDRAWILEWVEIAEELEAKLKKLGGRIAHYIGKGPTTTTGYYVYHPSSAPAPGTMRPLMVLFDPSGHAWRYLLRHIEAGEATQFTLVTCDEFRNTKPDEETQLEITRLGELLPLILKTVPHDPRRLFLGGTSGGASGAFLFTTKIQNISWAGVYSNVGWLGGSKNWNLPYPAGMRVAMVNGDKDAPVKHWVDSDSAALKRCGIDVSVMAFEGGHQIPPVSVQIKAFKWLLREID